MCQCLPLSQLATRSQTAVEDAASAGAARAVLRAAATPIVVATAVAVRWRRWPLRASLASTEAACTDASERVVIRTFPDGVGDAVLSDRSPSSWACGRH